MKSYYSLQVDLLYLVYIDILKTIGFKKYSVLSPTISRHRVFGKIVYFFQTFLYCETELYRFDAVGDIYFLWCIIHLSGTIQDKNQFHRKIKTVHSFYLHHLGIFLQTRFTCKKWLLVRLTHLSCIRSFYYSSGIHLLL